MYEFKVKTRSDNINLSDLRQQGFIPGEVYGHNKKNIHVIISRVDFEKLFNQVGESNLVMLTIDNGKPFNVLIKDVQFDAVTDQVIHVDFYIVKMDEKLSTDLPLEFIGISKAVKELGGILVKSLDHVPITCLPNDLVAKVDINISALDDFGKIITVGDIKWPTGIEVLLENDVPICSVQHPRVEVKSEGEVTTSETEGARVEGESEGVKTDEDNNKDN